MSNRQQIKQRVIRSAEAALEDHHYVSPLDVLVGMGWLQHVHVQDWRKGKISFLEAVIQGNLKKISFAMTCFRSWAREKGLKPSETKYLARTSGPKRELQFSKSGLFNIEVAYRTHYISPSLTEKNRIKLQDKLEKSPDLIVYIILNGTRCSQCNTDLQRNSFLLMEGDWPLCMRCAGLGDLVFLPSGDARVTRQAKKVSNKSAIVVKFSKTRKRYERQGLLVEEAALKQAFEDFDL